MSVSLAKTPLTVLSAGPSAVDEDAWLLDEERFGLQARQIVDLNTDLVITDLDAWADRFGIDPSNSTYVEEHARQWCREMIRGGIKTLGLNADVR